MKKWKCMDCDNDFKILSEKQKIKCPKCKSYDVISEKAIKQLKTLNAIKE